MLPLCTVLYRPCHQGVIETFGAHLSQTFTSLWDGLLVGKGQLDFITQLQLCVGGMLATGVGADGKADGGAHKPQLEAKHEAKKEEKKPEKKSGGVSQMYAGSKTPLPPANAASSAAAPPKAEPKKKKQDAFPCPAVEEAQAKLKLFLSYPRGGTFFTTVWQVRRVGPSWHTFPASSLANLSSSPFIRPLPPPPLSPLPSLNPPHPPHLVPPTPPGLPPPGGVPAGRRRALGPPARHPRHRPRPRRDPSEEDRHAPLHACGGASRRARRGAGGQGAGGGALACLDVGPPSASRHALICHPCTTVFVRLVSGRFDPTGRPGGDGRGGAGGAREGVAGGARGGAFALPGTAPPPRIQAHQPYVAPDILVLTRLGEGRGGFRWR